MAEYALTLVTAICAGLHTALRPQYERRRLHRETACPGGAALDVFAGGPLPAGSPLANVVDKRPGFIPGT